MAVYPFLKFNGNCKEALEYYAGVFGVSYKAMAYGDVPIEMQPHHPVMDDISNHILYAEMKIDDSLVLFEDNISMEIEKGNHVSLTLRLKDINLVNKYFDTLAKDGKVVMALSKFFWSDAYGVVVDKFGVEWKINLEK